MSWRWTPSGLTRTRVRSVTQDLLVVRWSGHSMRSGWGRGRRATASAVARRRKTARRALELAADEAESIATHERESGLGSVANEIQDRRCECGRDAQDERQVRPRRRRAGRSSSACAGMAEIVAATGWIGTVVVHAGAVASMGSTVQRKTRRGGWPPQSRCRPGRPLPPPAGRPGGSAGPTRHANMAVGGRAAARPDRRARPPHGACRRRHRRSSHRPGQGPRSRACGRRSAGRAGPTLGGDHECHERTLAVLQRGLGRFAGTGQVAGPPAHLGEIDQSVLVQRIDARQGLELGTGQGQRAEAQVDTGQREVRRASVDRAVGIAVMTAAAGADRDRAGAEPAPPPPAAARRPGPGRRPRAGHPRP